jgi:ferredoxin-NADP reductase
VRESDDVTSLFLEPTDGAALTRALPGQFIVLRLGSGAAPPIIRSYSLSGEPGTTSFRVSVKREPHGAAGRYIDEDMKVGEIVQSSAARGVFTLQPGDGPLVFLSAGIGVTPVLAMLHALSAAASTREIWWLYGARRGREHPFAVEARKLLATLPDHHHYICYSAPDPEDRLGVDFDAPGRLSGKVLQDLGVPRGADFYLCGPSVFMDSLTDALGAMGVAPDHVHREAFGPRDSSTPGVAPVPQRPPHMPAGVMGAGPLVTFARSGIAVRWSPTFPSVLEFAEACDVPVRWSCRAGVCHSCETALLSGAIAYQPEPVDPPPEGNVLICCCRPAEDLVIDL